MPTPAVRFAAAAVLLAALAAAPLHAQDGDVPAPDGWTALRAGQHSKAAAIFRAALDRAPREPLLHFGAAQASLALGRTDAAIAGLKRAIEHDPLFIEAMLQLAYVAYAAADLDLAVRTMEKAAALQPENARIAAQLAAWRGESALHGAFESVPGQRFLVRFEGAAQKATGERVLAILDEAYVSVGHALNIYPGPVLEIILYSQQQFQDITRAPAWAGGGYDGRIRLPIGGAPSQKALRRVLRHEYVHAVVKNAAGDQVPAWVNEGLASYFESADHGWARDVLRQTRVRIGLEDLVEGFGRFDGALALVAYAESLVAAELLCEVLNPHVGPFLQLLGNGYTIDEALNRHGVDPARFRTEWARRVGLRAD